MGTNYYFRGFANFDDIDNHVGKRSAAGWYCWDCRRTLCKEGESGIHYNASGWYTKCPVCGKKQKKENLDNSASGRELGFNKNQPQKKTGVATCSSFSWGIKEEEFRERCKLFSEASKSDVVIENEYGDLFTLEEFYEILEECPVQYTDSIGQYFS